MNLEVLIEGVLFYVSEPISIARLAKLLEVEVGEIDQAIVMLEASLSGRGITLVRESDTLALMTAPALSTVIEKIRKEELRRDSGKAGAETLAIVAYNTSITRAEIDFIRGVNSTFVLRNLQMRGLIERIQNPQDQRSYAYRPTVALYAHLGISRKEDLPEFAEITEAIQSYTAEHTKDDLNLTQTS